MKKFLILALIVLATPMISLADGDPQATMHPGGDTTEATSVANYARGSTNDTNCVLCNMKNAYGPTLTDDNGGENPATVNQVGDGSL